MAEATEVHPETDAPQSHPYTGLGKSTARVTVYNPSNLALPLEGLAGPRSGPHKDPEVQHQ